MKINNELENKDILLVAIGSGNAEQAKKFKNKLDFKADIYIDPSLKSYKAFKLKRGLFRTLGPVSIYRGLKAMSKGFRQGKSAGDLWQQGGLFIITPENKIAFEHRNSTAGDQADLDLVLKVASENQT
ncbi:MAG: peroxiredoxin-like family protein [Thermodesulfobacteriota bacterium]